MKKSILIIALSNLQYDARVRRQVQALKDEYAVTLAGFGGAPSTEYELLTLSPTPLHLWRKAITSVFLLLRLYRVAYKLLHNYLPFIRTKLAGRNFDLIISNDVETLPLAFSLPGKHKVLFDAHEYAPRHFEDKLMWRIFFQSFNIWLCKKYLPRTTAMTTVGRGLAREYNKNFGVQPTVIPNANNYTELAPSPTPDNRIRLVHTGIANRSRKLELMINMMTLLDDRFTLDLYLLTPGFASSKTKNYLLSLQESVKGNSRVRILPPIRNEEIVKTINSYDIGVFLLPPINFNYQNALPNKFFDFIQARLGIAIGPTPEMAEIVKEFENGVIAKDFTAESLALELNKLTQQDIIKFKENSGKAARQYNAENNMLAIKKILREIL